MKAIRIKSIDLHAVSVPLVEGLRTSYGAEPLKTAVLVELTTESGLVGWGECPTKPNPSYSYETMGTSLHVLTEFLIPKLIGQAIDDATQVPALLKSVRGFPMAKYAVEAAVWDALAQANAMSLAQSFAQHLPDGHESRGYATVGVSIGIQESLDETLAIIKKRVDQGYGRIKLKIEPGWDIELARAVREAFPDVSLMLDANSAYSLNDSEHLKQLDALDLLMLEQPLGYNDIYEHSKLQPQLETAVCLDESIHTADDVRLAIALGACKIINLKPARVGGYTESLEIYRVCVEHDMALWIGGMLETGIGRAANVAFASMPGVTLPCDISATDRYYDPDITEPPFVLGEQSRIAVPDGVGLGVEIQRDRIVEAESRWQQHYPYKV